MTKRRATNLPKALKPLIEQDRWVIWNYVRGRKVPFQARRPDRCASTRRPSTWATFFEARKAGKVGFVLLGSGIGALDLDDCRNSKTGRIDEWAKRLVDRSESYCEVTPSGKGLRIIGFAKGPSVQRAVRKGAGQLEIYRDCPRYITVTGDQLGTCRRLNNIDWLINELTGFLPVPVTLNIKIGKIDPRCDEWRAILKRHGLSRLGLYVRSSASEGRRSDVIWKLGRSLADRGATVNEVACVLWASKAWQSKHGTNMRALDREIVRVFSK